MNNSEQLELWEKIVNLCEQDKSVADPKILSSAYWQFVELLDDSVSNEKQLPIWKRFLEIERQVGDEEDIKLIGEIIEGMEKE